MIEVNIGVLYINYKNIYANFRLNFFKSFPGTEGTAEEKQTNPHHEIYIGRERYDMKNSF